ncbi:hypothetical protein ES703_76138 [subsurface metagenome]
MICLELRNRNRQHCGCHPIAGVEFCAFLRGRTCLVEQHNQAVKRAFDAGLNKLPLPEDLYPANYRIPSEGGK